MLITLNVLNATFYLGVNFSNTFVNNTELSLLIKGLKCSPNVLQIKDIDRLAVNTTYSYQISQNFINMTY